MRKFYVGLVNEFLIPRDHIDFVVDSENMTEDECRQMIKETAERIAKSEHGIVQHYPIGRGNEYKIRRDNIWIASVRLHIVEELV